MANRSLLAAGRRRALTLRFARIAATRLRRPLDPEAGLDADVTLCRDVDQAERAKRAIVALVL